MQRKSLFLTILFSLCLFAVETSSAQELARQQKIPEPASPEQIANAKRHSKEVLSLFRESCFKLAGDTDTILAQSLVSGMKELKALDPLDNKNVQSKNIRNLKKYVQGQQINLRLESRPWKCTVYSEGVIDTEIIEGANSLYRELYIAPEYSNLDVVNHPDIKDFDKTHSFIDADRDDGAHLRFRITYGGLAPDRTVLSLEFTPPRKRKPLSEYLRMEVGKEQMQLPLPKRNSKIVMTILEKTCIENLGKFNAIAEWANTHLTLDGEFAFDATQGTWIAEDQSLTILLHAQNSPQTPCIITGHGIDADTLHRNFQEMLSTYARQPEKSIAANQYSSIKYKVRPNNMPENIPYYSGGILRSRDKKPDKDVVVETKREGNKYHFSINVHPTGQP